MYRSKGFTVVELITVLILIGVLAGAAISRLIPSSTYQLQSSRDQVVAAFFSAQQLAMTRLGTVQLVISGGQVDIQLDSSSVRTGGVQYPVALLANQSLTSLTVTYDRLGQPNTGASLTLSQSGASVPIVLTASGYAY